MARGPIPHFSLSWDNTTSEASLCTSGTRFPETRSLKPLVSRAWGPQTLMVYLVPTTSGSDCCLELGRRSFWFSCIHLVHPPSAAVNQDNVGFEGKQLHFPTLSHIKGRRNYVLISEPR